MLKAVTSAIPGSIIKMGIFGPAKGGRLLRQGTAAAANIIAAAATQHHTSRDTTTLRHSTEQHHQQIKEDYRRRFAARTEDDDGLFLAFIILISRFPWGHKRGPESAPTPSDHVPVGSRSVGL